MKIENAQYEIHAEKKYIRATIDDTESIVPLDPDNRHYAEILRLVHTGQLKIKEADD